MFRNLEIFCDRLVGNLIANLKYWLLGNFLSFNTGLIVIFTHSMINRYSPIDWYMFFIAPFLAGFFIKLLKQDLPVYYYGTSGLIWQICMASFMQSMTVSEFRGHPYPPRDFPTTWEIFLNDFFLQGLIAAIIGGAIIDIYRFFKNKNK